MLRLLNDLISRNIVWPLLFLYSKDFSSALYRELDAQQFLSPGQLRKLQFEKLKALLLHCKETVPYYRDMFARVGLDPAKMKDARDIARIPFLTKDIIRAEGGRLVSDRYDVKALRRNSSGGSTGEPLNFYQDDDYWRHVSSTTCLSDRMQGWRFGARTAYLWGSPRDTRQARGIVSGGKLALLNQRWYDSFNMSGENMEGFHEDMGRFRPDVIIAYASSLFIFARFLEEKGIRPGYPSASLIASAEVLTDPMRHKIEDVFARPVFDRYGSREVGIVASECDRHRGLHVHMYNMYVECVDPSTGDPVDEGTGELAITLFTNYAMPFVRYRIGDIGEKAPGRCPCGRGTEVLARVVGRTSDTITTGSGRLVHGEYFTHVFYGVEGIRQFQFVQEDRACYRVLIAAEKGFDRALLPRLEEEIRKVLDPGDAVKFEFVEKIEAADSGKYRFTVSRLPLEVGNGS